LGEQGLGPTPAGRRRTYWAMCFSGTRLRFRPRAGRVPPNRVWHMIAAMPLVPSPWYSGERDRVTGSFSPAPRRIHRAHGVRPLTPALSPGYRGEGEKRGRRSPETGVTPPSPDVPRSPVKRWRAGKESEREPWWDRAG
jgi:hypothetical protein